ncbi:GGDEF domain-containing protein [Patescibacteria group bacterium]|nr:GGDEF domain-containing protein [Patescibacteria group bacterium]
MPFKKESRLLFVKKPGDSNIPTDIQSEGFFVEKQRVEERLPEYCSRQLTAYLETCNDTKLRNVITVETDEGKTPLIDEVLKRIKEGACGYIKRNVPLLNRMSAVERDITGDVTFFEESVLAQIKEITPRICREVYLELDNERLKLDSMKDELTGLPNRRSYNEHKVAEIAYTERNGPLMLLIFDIDHFKSVNDEYGHLAGDQVLKEMGRRIREVVRDADFVCRWGGEEFVVLMRNTTIEGGKLGAARIMEAITVEPYEIEDQHGKTIILNKTVSIGGAPFTGRDLDPTGEIMEKSADNCLYILKGKTPDNHGHTADRRGNIAFNGRVIPKGEIKQLQEVLSQRDERGKIVGLNAPKDPAET